MNISLVLAFLHWLPVRSRMHFTVLLVTYKGVTVVQEVEKSFSNQKVASSKSPVLSQFHLNKQ